MGRGPKNSAQRAKASKHMRSAGNKKRFRNDSEAQKKYHEAIALRRAKRAKRKGK